MISSAHFKKKTKLYIYTMYYTQRPINEWAHGLHARANIAPHTVVGSQSNLAKLANYNVSHLSVCITEKLAWRMNGLVNGDGLRALLLKKRTARAVLQPPRVSAYTGRSTNLLEKNLL